jgi:hypothetical protein
VCHEPELQQSSNKIRSVITDRYSSTPLFVVGWGIRVNEYYPCLKKNKNESFFKNVLTFSILLLFIAVRVLIMPRYKLVKDYDYDNKPRTKTRKDEPVH